MYNMFGWRKLKLYEFNQLFLAENIKLNEISTKIKWKQEMLRLVTIAKIWSTLALPLWKFQYFRKPIYNSVEHLWWSFYFENSKPLSIFTKKLHRRSSFGFSVGSSLGSTFWRLPFKRFISSKYFTLDSTLKGSWNLLFL